MSLPCHAQEAVKCQKLKLTPSCQFHHNRINMCPWHSPHYNENECTEYESTESDSAESASFETVSAAEEETRLHSEALWERGQGLATLFLEHAQPQQLEVPPPLQPSVLLLDDHCAADDVVIPVNNTQTSAEHVTHGSPPNFSALKNATIGSAAVQSCTSISQLGSSLATAVSTTTPVVSELASLDEVFFVGRAAGPPQHRTVGMGTHVVQPDDALVGRAVGPPQSRSMAVGTDVAYLDPGQV